MQTTQDLINRAAAAIAEADALLITAGAGMGVDSGLPDFRGPEGFWNAYPPYRDLGLDFIALANPRWFRSDPILAWGFYGHRLNLYRKTAPHYGFEILRGWSENMKQGAFVFTSNVDGHFQRAGFDENCVTEVHGSILHGQCLLECGGDIFSTERLKIAIDERRMRCSGALPLCPACGALARPNILMFFDGGWDARRTMQQERRMNEWLANVYGKLVVIELGAGSAVPSVRCFSEAICQEQPATLIRINPLEPEAPDTDGGIEIPLGALDALQAIAAALG